MFSLDQSITEWRQQMLAAGIKRPVPLEELESHLREEIERQVQSGADERRAFEISVAKIGEAILIETEFKKISTPEKVMIRIIAVLAAILGTVLGGGMIMPALGMWRARGVLHAGPLLMGCALVIVTGCAVVYGIVSFRGSRGRRLISAFLILAGCFYEVPLIQAFFIRSGDWAGYLFCGCLAAVSILFYGSCLYRLWRLPTIQS